MYKALSIRNIIESLIDPSNNVDTKLLHIFLYTYRSYCTSMEIISLIDERFYSLSKEETLVLKSGERDGFTNAVVMLINTWLTLPFAYDFYERPDFPSLNHLLLSIRKWPDEVFYIKNSYKFSESFKRLEDKLNDLLNEFSQFNADSWTREVPIDCTGFSECFPKSKYRTFFNFNSKVIANALTHLDTEMLKKLRLPELILHSKSMPAPTVIAVINNYNHLYKVVSSLVHQPDLAHKSILCGHTDRSTNNNEIADLVPLHSNAANGDMSYQLTVVEVWIHVAQHLCQVHNFSSIVAIITALDSEQIMKELKRKSPKLFSQYSQFRKLVEPASNSETEKMLLDHQNENEKVSGYINYFKKNKRKARHLKQYNSEIPHLGEYLRHLRVIDDAFPDWLDPSDLLTNQRSQIYDGTNERLVNLDKCRKQFDVLAQVRLCITALSASSQFSKPENAEENNHELEELHSFLDWYNWMLTYCQSTTSQTNKNKAVSTESIMSSVSFDSSESSLELKIRQKISSISNSKSHECLSEEITRRRLVSTPTNRNISSDRRSRNSYIEKANGLVVYNDINNSVENNNNNSHQNNSSPNNNICNKFIVATVKLKLNTVSDIPNLIGLKLSSSPKYGSQRIAGRNSSQEEGTVASRSKKQYNHQTVASGTPNKGRPPLPPGLIRSQTSAGISPDTQSEPQKLSLNISNINYKKMQVYESDHTTNFIRSVLEKFGKPNWDSDNFEVWQKLDNDKEIQIPSKANIYYALASRPEISIEVRQKPETAMSP